MVYVKFVHTLHIIYTASDTNIWYTYYIHTKMHIVIFMQFVCDSIISVLYQIVIIVLYQMSILS